MMPTEPLSFRSLASSQMGDTLLRLAVTVLLLVAALRIAG